MGLGGAQGTHLGEGDAAAGTAGEGGGLEGGFGARQAPADDVDSFHIPEDTRFPLLKGGDGLRLTA